MNRWLSEQAVPGLNFCHVADIRNAKMPSQFQLVLIVQNPIAMAILANVEAAVAEFFTGVATIRSVSSQRGINHFQNLARNAMLHSCLRKRKKQKVVRRKLPSLTALRQNVIIQNRVTMFLNFHCRCYRNLWEKLLR